MAQPVRHPALRDQDALRNAAAENSQLAQQNDQLQIQGQQVAAENAQMREAMANPNIDTNIGGLAGGQDVGPKLDPIQALYDGVSEGATLDDLAEVGMMEPAIAEMTRQGFTEDDQARMLQELDQLSQTPNTSQGASPYSLGR